MADGAQRGLRVLVADERGRPVRVPGLAAWIRRVAPTRTAAIVSVALVSDRRIRALNREYRRKDAVTDVLSFPVSREARWGRQGRWGRSGEPRPPHRRRSTYQPHPPYLPDLPLLGDIAIARGVARRQAREAGHSESTELRVLLLHGILHLLGYDHEHDDGEMRRVERRLRRRGGLRESLIERAGR